MEILEYKLKVYLLKDINQGDALDEISKFIDYSFLKNEELKKMHKENIYKPYVFNSFFPIESEGIYKEGWIYSVMIRVLNVSDALKKHFEKILINTATKKIKGLTITKRKIDKNIIEKVYSITPCVIKNDKGYWKESFPVSDFERWLKENLIKKYNYFYDKKINEEFELFSCITFENKVPISVKIKNVKLLGDKITLHISNNEYAQKLAYMALGTGILEGNARGFGFVNHKYYTWR